MAAKDPDIGSQISDKIDQLAEMIAEGIAGKVPGGEGLRRLERFKCTDYICEGAEFTCTKFRCGAGFKVQSAVVSAGV